MTSTNYKTTDNLRVLIIGKNSRIVKAISNFFPNFDYISHNDILNTDVGIYDNIFLFSWCNSSLKNNLDILNKLNLSNTIFISTVAVFSCAKRAQWANYPNWKSFCEGIVLRAGGKIIRIGIWDHDLIKHMYGYIPVTSIKSLVNSIYECIQSDNKVYYPIELVSGELRGVGYIINRFINFLSYILPNISFLQVLIVVISKLLGFKNYGYTQDCLFYFCERLLIGYGVVGSAVSNKLKAFNLSHQVIVSLEPDIYLNKNGFNGTRIGKCKIGLSKLWHGVRIIQTKNGIFYKKVPLFVNRKNVPNSAIYGSVNSLKLAEDLSSASVKNDFIEDLRVFSKQIHLAAGVVNNIRILQASFPISANLSDHEVSIIGKVDTNDLILSKYIRRKFGIVYGRSVFVRNIEGVNFMVDFRPIAPPIFELDSQNIYSNRTSQIILKLYRSMSLKLINQAFFNKFGFGVDLGQFSVVMQIEAEKCIFLDSDGQMIRNRLPSIIFDRAAAVLKADFPSFQRHQNIETFDAIHIHGGFDLEKHRDLKKHVTNGTLIIYGNTFDDEPLGPFHNTHSMTVQSCTKVDNFYSKN